MKLTTQIYCLCEPGTRTIRYIGKTDNPGKRLSGHLSRARKGATGHRANFIRKLMKGGQLPDMHLLCEVPSDDWERFERAFITLGRQCGFNLTNVMDGGQGPRPETCVKLSAAGLGRKHTPESRARIKAALSGKPKSLAHCAKMSEVNKGKTMPLETRKKISDSLRGEKNHNFRKTPPSQTLSKLREKKPGAGSKFFGVSWCCATKKWKVQLSAGSGDSRIRFYLGCFSDELEAARVYDAAVKKYLPPFAKLNFPG